MLDILNESVFNGTSSPQFRLSGSDLPSISMNQVQVERASQTTNYNYNNIKMSEPRKCPGCSSTRFKKDISTALGDLSCLECGMVFEENPIVSEVQFGESSSGAATVQGAMVGADQARASHGPRNALESREQTILNAKQQIKRLAQSMGIADFVSEAATGWFKLALFQNFVQGRRSQNVLAACLYVACRHEKTSHLLIDFSSRLQISVYSLGATYLKLVRALQIQKMPLAEPSFFIQHFADRLELGNQTPKIVHDATQLALRMASDWIKEGRRPAGIAGACILLASRMNNMQRSHSEVVAVAHVGEETIQKRLNEFKKTTSARLTVEVFRESEDTHDSKPPSFQKNRRIELKVQAYLKERQTVLERYRDMAKNKKLYSKLNVSLRNDTDEAEREENPSKELVEGAPNAEGDAESAAAVSKGAFATAEGDENHNEASSTVPQAEKSPGENDKKPTSSELEREDSSDVELEEVEDNGKEDPLFVPSTYVARRRTRRQANRSAASGQSPEAPLERFEDARNDVSTPPTLAELDFQENGAIASLNEEEEEERTERSRRRAARRPAARRIAVEETSDSEVKRHVRTKKKRNTRDALLKAVLNEGTLTEDQLEIALDKILTSQRQRYGLPQGEEEHRNGDEVEIEVMIEKNRPQNLADNLPTTHHILSKVSDEQELCSDDDINNEFEDIRLSEEDARQKERIWISLHHEFLIAQEKKKLKREADELTGNTSGTTRKKRKSKDSQIDPVINQAVVGAIHLIGEDGKPITPAESTRQYLQKKSFSKKINYDSITLLFGSLGSNED